MAIGQQKHKLTADDPAAKRMPVIIGRLRQAYPDAACELLIRDPFQLLIATILSAQCTDRRVNQVTTALFAKYPGVMEVVGAERSDIEELIRPTGFFHQKARYIQESATRILFEFGGEVPDEMDALLSLPGVARKTANVVLGVGYSKAAGIVVDTHVKRLSGRLGLSNVSSPETIERDLMLLLPSSDWIDLSHLLIFHGRRTCKARRPDCSKCPLEDICPSALH